MSCTVPRCIHENELRSQALTSGTACWPGWFAKISKPTALLVSYTHTQLPTHVSPLVRTCQW